MLRFMTNRSLQVYLLLPGRLLGRFYSPSKLLICSQVDSRDTSILMYELYEYMRLSPESKTV